MPTKTAQITIKADNGADQDVGYRVFILTTLKGFGLESSLPVNIPGGGVKVFVKGDEEIIRGAVKELREHKPEVEKVGRVVVSVVFGDYEFKSVNGEDIQFLTLNQLSKGIPAIIRMDKAVSSMDTHLTDVALGVKELDSEIEPVSSGVSEIGRVVGGLDSKYHTISKTLYVQLSVSVLILAALVYGLLAVLH